MKKTAFILIIVILLSVLVPVANAVGGTLELSGGNVTASAGETVYVAVEIGTNPGFAAISLWFDADDGLTIKSVENKTNMALTYDGAVCLWDNPTNYTKSGMLAVLEVEVAEDLADGVYEIRMALPVGGDCCDADQKDVDVAFTSATVTVAKAALELSGENVTASAGETVYVAVEIGKNPGFAAISLWFDADDGLTIKSVENKTNMALTYDGAVCLWDNPTNYTELGVFAILEVEVAEDLADGVYEIRMALPAGGDCCDADQKDVDVVFTGAIITVETEEVVIYNGTCGAEGDGSNLTWTLNSSSGVLNITGTGDMADWEESSETPWYDYCEEIKKVVVGKGVANVGYYAFAEFETLESVVLSESVRVIGEAAFSGCIGLVSVVIPEGVTDIEDEAFYDCESLVSVMIPRSAESIGSQAFRNCDSLESIYFYSEEVAITNHKNTISDSATIYGYEGSTAEAYATKFKRTFVVIPDTEIRDNITVLEADVTYTLSGGTGNEALISYQKGGESVDLLYVDKATGELKFKSASGSYQTLLDGYGSQITLGSTPVSLAVIYDDIRGTVRYYVDGSVPYYNNEGTRDYANDIAVRKAFVNATGSEEITLLEDAFENVVKYNVHDSGTAEIVAFQDYSESNNIRILSCVDMPWYSAIGYEVEAFIDGDGQGEKTLMDCVVFESVIADRTEVVAKDEYGYNYFSAFEIDDVYVVSDVTYYIIVKPFTEVGNTRYYGSAVKIDIDYNGNYSFDEKYVG